MTTGHTVFVVNPGSTSTKVAVVKDGALVVNASISHSSEDLGRFKTIWDQFEFRRDLVARWASENVPSCSAVAAIGGLFRPVQGGVYRVNDKMLADARANYQGEHASNLGCALADDCARRYNVPAFVVDPVSVDEFEPLAYYSGHPKIRRRSLSHALNIHATARRAAADLKLDYTSASFIVAHLGGGISIAPVRGGRIIDANDAASDGPFSPERTGGLPLQPFISLCFSGEYKERDVAKLVMGRGGVVAYTGTNSVVELEKRIAGGDKTAEEVYRAMGYQIAKEIGAMATVLNGAINAIILTGGLARSEMLTTWIRERTGFIAPVRCYPGEDELQALADGALRVLRGEEQAKEY
jgi:butyrate kinase